MTLSKFRCLARVIGCLCLQLCSVGLAFAACPGADSGLALPSGFCATVFADEVGHARHLTVSDSGTVYVNTWSGRYYGGAAPVEGAFLVALKDTHGTGSADAVQRFGETGATGNRGGTGIALHGSWLYAESNDKIVRYALRSEQLAPDSAPQTVVSGLPMGGDHPMHPFAIDAAGNLYVDVATASNACQLKNRALKSPGAMPCDELITRGGIWRFSADTLDQVFSPAQRYATGIRNAEGIAVDSAGGRVFISQHGRDQLHANWPDRYRPEEEATLPAEEVMLLKQGGDYGWPTCYYDAGRKALVLAPEYGGDGHGAPGPCGGKLPPVAAFPAHWAPNSMVFYEKTSFPPRYRNGLFIAFHGSWDRAPYGQQGFNVVFQPLAGAQASGVCEIFADGFAGAISSSAKAQHRPSGVAVGPDGALYVADDVRGRIYRIVYVGSATDTAARPMPCPDPAAGPGPMVAKAVVSNAPLPVPPGATVAMVALGSRLYHGEVGGAGCTGCHGEDGKGTTLGPNLADHEWLWSDGSLQGIATTIRQGVAQPKQFRAPMPAMGGAQLTAEQVSALAAYVWGLSRGP